MNYLIVCNTQGKLYLLMNRQDESSAIQAYASKQEVMDAFKGYTEGWTEGIERSASYTIGMMNMQPVAIQAPEDAATLTQYITEMKTYTISGGAMGRGYVGLPVKEEILKFKQFSVWEESMRLAGIKK